jgi:hypothetical protein
MHWSYSQLAPPTIAPFTAEQTVTGWGPHGHPCHYQAVPYDVDLHVVSPSFGSRKGRTGESTGEFGVQVNEGPIAEAIVDGLSFRSVGR